MLRRAASAAVMASAAASAAASVARREIVVYSQQHPVLTANQKALGSPSNVWIEEWELPRLELKADPKAMHTTLRVEKQLELFNFDQLVSAPEVMEAPKHSSYSTRTVYRERMQFELNDRAQKHGFQSHWWITRRAAFKDGLQLRPNARASLLRVESMLTLLHSSQIIGGEMLDTYPVSGGSRRLYSSKGDVFELLKEHIKSNGFNSGLYFSRRQLESFKLSPKPKAQPLLTAGDRQMLYNVEQLEDPNFALTFLSRAPVSSPTSLVSGDPINPEDAKRFPKKFKSNYWLTGREAELYQWTVREDQRREGVVLASSAAAPTQIELYNVEQLQNPEEAFAKAGLYTQ